MVERKLIKFISSLDPEFKSSVEPVVQLAPTIIAMYQGYDGLTFRVAPTAIGETLNLDECKTFELPIDGKITNEDYRWLASASFLDVVTRFAK